MFTFLLFSSYSYMYLWKILKQLHWKKNIKNKDNLNLIKNVSSSSSQIHSFMNTNFIKTLIWIVLFMLWRSFVIFFALRPSDLITTLTYVLMDNFCPCFACPSKCKGIYLCNTFSFWMLKNWNQLVLRDGFDN